MELGSFKPIKSLQLLLSLKIETPKDRVYHEVIIWMLS